MIPAASEAATPTVWADAHNHLHDSRLDGCRERCAECIVNATREDDWNAVLAIASSPSRHAAIGIHPWFAHTAAPGWDTRLRTLLLTNPEAGVGECGLDAKSRTSPLDIQIPVFSRQLALARELNRPITIHCVGAWGRLIDLLKQSPPPDRWLLHAFNGSRETARQLAKTGAFFSISARALDPRNPSILDVFQAIPPDRILLESDAPNHPIDLAPTGTAIAEKLGSRPGEFARLTRDNFHRFLNLGESARPQRCD
jgi:TatD DNase family protein